MRTLLLAPELFTTDSGIPRCLRLYLKALCELPGGGRCVRFVSLNDTAADTAALRPHIDTGLLDRWRTCARSKTDFIRSTLRLSAGIELIVCGHVAQLPVAWLAALLRPGLRYALVAHGIEVWRPFGFLERLALKGAWRVFCVSDFTRREILAHISLPAGRALVVPNALDPSLEAPAAPAAAPGPAPVILAVSRLYSADNYKGVDHLVEAMPAILASHPSAVLRVVGRGDDRGRLEKLALDRGVAAAVEFAGFLDDSRLRDEFSRCTVFALPSQKEGFGLVYLEAMTHGKPCIAAKAGGAPEVITPGSGLLVPYGDVAALAAACVKAISVPWDADIIRACARRFSYQEFSQRLQRLLPA